MIIIIIIIMFIIIIIVIIIIIITIIMQVARWSCPVPSPVRSGSVQARLGSAWLGTGLAWH